MNMDELNLMESLIPLASQFALGAVAGFVVGFALRKAGKFLAIAIVVAFVGIQLLGFYDVIDMGPVTALYDRAYSRLEGELPTLWTLISVNVPAVVGAVVGLIVGLRRTRKKE